MKFIVTIKDPDCLHDAIRDAVKAEVAKLELPEDEAENIIETRMEKVHEKLSKWVDYGEYYQIEFDTDANTATVVPYK